jgi:hypothetical protein
VSGAAASGLGDRNGNPSEMDRALLPPPTPGPTPRRRIRLNSASAVARELGRLYKDARHGRVEPGDATKLAYILDLLRKSLESADLEQRLEAVERTLALRKKDARDKARNPAWKVV